MDQLRPYIKEFSSIKGSREKRALRAVQKVRGEKFPKELPYFDIYSGSQLIKDIFGAIDTEYTVSKDGLLLIKKYKMADMKYDDFLDIRNRYLLGLDLKDYKDIRKAIGNSHMFDFMDDDTLAKNIVLMLDAYALLTERFKNYTSIYEKPDENISETRWNELYDVLDPMFNEELDEPQKRAVIKDLMKYCDRHRVQYTLKPRIIKLRAIYIQGEDLMVMTDNYMTKLTDFITENYYRYQVEGVHYMYLVSEIVSFLHAINYIHGHLSLDAFSIIIDKDKSYKILLNDLGYMRRGDVARTMPKLKHFSPSGEYRLFANDVYSMGMVFAQIISPQIMDDWIAFHPNGGVPPRFLQVYPSIRQLIDDCTKKLPNDRIDAIEATETLSRIYSTIPSDLEF